MSIDKIQFFAFILLCTFYYSCNSKGSNSNNLDEEIDSTRYFIDQSKFTNFSVNERIKHLKRAYNINSLIVNDSLKNRNLLKIAYEAEKINDTSFFKTVNKEAFNLSQKLNDTFGIADAQWNFGSFYYSKEAWEASFKNYYQAHANFEAIDKNLFSGKMLFNMANVQSRLKDYTGCEITLYKAISKLTPLNSHLPLYRCYSLLGIISRELNEYENSIKHTNKALEYLSQTNDNRPFREMGLNTIGLVYQDLKNHKAAINYFNMALKRDQLFNEDLNLYARLIDNYAYNKFLSGDTTNILQDFKKSLTIRDSVNNTSGIIISKLHLAEFYGHQGDTSKAILFAKEAKRLSSVVNNNRDWLASLKLLSKLDKANKSNYLNSYILLNDSLQFQERVIRNKFTRIQYETDEYIEETERLTTQNILIVIIGTVFLTILLLLYLIKIQRSKNKELLFESEQQKANEEIYSLMLKQQTEKEEGRKQERDRISEDLHDGVLGKLYGTRIGMGFLDFDNEESINKFDSYLEEIQLIEQEIRDISHELKHDKTFADSEFSVIIEQFLINQSILHNFKYELINKDTLKWSHISDHIKVNVYRITQEIIQNIIKHANASHVMVTFSFQKKCLNLNIQDNGVGFILTEKNNGIGLKNIKSRIDKLKGLLKINSSTEKGTLVILEIPI